MQITKNCVATLEYTLMNDQGQVLDSSRGRAPMAYLHGVGGILPGLEQALEGKRTGDTLKVTLPPEQAYGPRNDQLIHVLPRENFTGVDNIAVGMKFAAQGENGGQRIVTVVAVDDKNVTVDANHPLAGKPVTCEVTILDVREASEEEISHSHVCYGSGDCGGGHCGGGSCEE